MAQPSQPNPAGVSAGAPPTSAPKTVAAPAEAPASGGQTQSILQHLQNVGSDSTALKWILGTAAAGGLTGGLFSAQGGLREGETKGQRRKRILLNVLGSAAAGGAIPAALYTAKDFVGNEPEVHAETARAKWNKIHGGFAASPLARGVYSAGGGALGYMTGKKMDYKKAIGGLMGTPEFKSDAVALDHAVAGVKGEIDNIARLPKGSQEAAKAQARIISALKLGEASKGQRAGAIRALRINPITPTTREGSWLGRLFRGQGNSWSLARGMDILDRGRVGGALGLTLGAGAPEALTYTRNRIADAYNAFTAAPDPKAPANPGIWESLTHGKALNSD